MKSVYILRHADTERGDGRGGDHKRQLTEEGTEESANIGRWITETGLSIDTVLCSTAARARETLEQLGCPDLEAKASFSDELYLATTGELLHILSQLDDSRSSVLVIGHNPGLRELCRILAVDGDPKALETVSTRLQTGALVEISLPAETWADISRQSGTIHRYVDPASLS